METNPDLTERFPDATDDTSAEASLHSQLTMIEKTASAAHAAIDRFAARADETLRRVRDLASRAKGRFRTGCQSYARWEDECMEDTRERIRSRPLTAVALGVLLGLLLGRMTRS